MGASAASAGEVTGNCSPNSKSQGQSSDNCKKEFSQGASICKFSGQNDDPNSTNPENPGGRTQSYGQDVKSGALDPSTQNPGKVGQGVPTFQPGFACNGEHGFLAGG
jgi:hypothetical protein